MPTWDHPRMCGEKLCHRQIVRRVRGSPPHVRGKVDERSHENVEVRITPACAGKSLFLSIRTIFDQDHPRMCGEKLPLVLAGTDA